MRILVIGSGGREHALVCKISQPKKAIIYQLSEFKLSSGVIGEVIKGKKEVEIV